MTGGNDNNPVTLAGNSQITLGSASITFNGMPKRLQLSGTHSDNQVTGIISDTSNGTAGAKVTLIKSDTSTWHLMGSNSYTGETIVNSGTLILSQPSLDDTAAVRLTGTLQLNHSQTDTVGELYIAGQLQQPGIYDAANSDGYITGTGKLRVPGASGFDSWAAEQITNISPSADSTPGGDPDSDGMSNLAEFAFGGDPLSSASLGIRNVFTADTTADADTDKELILTLAVRAGETLEAFAGSPLQLAVAGVTYTIEGSLDLASFTAPVTEVAPVIEGLPSLPDGYEYRSFSLDGSNGLSGKGFLRAKVEN